MFSFLRYEYRVFYCWMKSGSLWWVHINLHINQAIKDGDLRRKSESWLKFMIYMSLERLPECLDTERKNVIMYVTLID